MVFVDRCLLILRIWLLVVVVVLILLLVIWLFSWWVLVLLILFWWMLNLLMWKVDFNCWMRLFELLLSRLLVVESNMVVLFVFICLGLWLRIS